jgi:hypothetical protein
MNLDKILDQETSVLENLKSAIEVELRERDCSKSDEEKDVHAAHCCSIHGCKYNDENCPVVLGTTEQRFPCIDCEEPIVDQYEWDDVDTYGPS